MKPWSRSAVLAASMALTCESPAPTDDVSHTRGTPLGEPTALVWNGDITLADPKAVLTVQPHVSVDPRGGFLVADSREAQIRRYGPDGTLLSRFGRKGSGPDEFRRPNGAHRLPSGRIVVFDTNGKLVLLDSSGTRSTETQQTGLVPLYQGTPLNDEYAVLSGRVDGQAVTNLVHVWNLRTRQLTSSFFPSPSHPEALSAAYAYAGFASIAVRKDTVAVLFALSDTLRLYTPTGSLIRSVKIPFSEFRKLRKPIPMSGPPAAMQQWRASFSVASSVFWAENGTILVQWYDVVAGENEWHLVGFDSQGRITVPPTDTPKLLAVSPNNPALFFEHRHSEEPNAWSIALLHR